MSLPSRRAIAPLVAAVLASAAPLMSDEIYLVGGGRLSGRVVERTATRVAIETGPGRVTLPLHRVERIVESRSALEAFAEQAAELDAGDVAGWSELARWAEERDLLTQARFAWQHVLARDPGHAEANAALGRVSVGGAWMNEADAYRARGYVLFEGRWVTPAEHEAAVREREADAAAALGQREADLRVQEAEARVREAEARARDAEYAAEQASEGIPLGYGGYGFGFAGVVPPHLPKRHCRHAKHGPGCVPSPFPYAKHGPRCPPSQFPYAPGPGCAPRQFEVDPGGPPNIIRAEHVPNAPPRVRPTPRPVKPPERRQAAIGLPPPRTPKN